MTRTTWLSALSCVAFVAVISGGCGGSSPAGTGKAGSGGKAGSSGGAGTTGTAGTTGGAGTTGTAGTGDAGTTGTAGTTGGAGTTGTAGTGSDGGAGTTGAAGKDGGAGTTGAAGAGSDGGNSDVKADTMSEAGGETAAPVCADMNACNENGSTCETPCRANGRRNFCICYDPAGGAARLEYNCFTDVACTNPPADGGTDAGTTSDAGTDAGGTSDAGTDAGTVIRACPAGIATGDACSTDGGGTGLCATTCSAANMQRTCTCGRQGWRCSQLHMCL